MEKEKLFYIQNGYSGNAIVWWGVDSKGYVTDLSKAGKYTWEQVEKRIERPEDTAWECDYIDNNLDAQKVIVDGQYLDTHKRINGRLN